MMVEGKKANLAMRIGFSIAGALGLASLCGGCNEELIRYQAVNARNVKQALAINALADVVGAEEQYQRDLNIAKEGRSEVNVNIGESNQRSPVYTNYIWDLNSNTILNEKPMSSSQVDEFVSGRFIPGKGYQILMYKDGVYDCSYNIRSP